METTADLMIPGQTYAITAEGPHLMEGVVLTYHGAVALFPDSLDPDIVLLDADVTIDGVRQRLTFAPGDVMIPTPA